MSKGPGRIQQAIVTAFEAESDNAFTTLELCERAYGVDADMVEKKHRIAVVRSAKKIPNLAWLEGGKLGGELVFYRSLDVMSYAMARLKADNFSRYRTRDRRAYWGQDEVALRKQLADDRHRALIAEGGVWWHDVEINKARASGDHERQAMLEKARASELQAFGEALRSMAGLVPGLLKKKRGAGGARPAV